MTLPLQPIGPEKASISHDPWGRYLYRGYAIMGQDDGWRVERADTPEGEDEIGWGCSMYEAMAVVNEIIEGDTRRKSR